MKNPFTTERAVNAAIKATSVTLGTVYVCSKTLAESAKKLEANIIHKLDNNYSKKEVRRARMESYFEVHNAINRKVAEVELQAHLVAVKLQRKSMSHEIMLMDKDAMKC